MCWHHLGQLGREWQQKQGDQDFPALETALEISASRQWVYLNLSRYQIVLDLVILDTEYSVASHQLLEFSIIDRAYGQTLINTTLKHPGKLCHEAKADKASSSRHLHAFQGFLSRQTAARIYSSSRPVISNMDVHEVAGKLRESDISKDAIFLN
ncbi:hypothetical protein E5D57_000649 [Metarhizium anisopliae]|nr:hypothetical protein E5D57_000649 [Metarhizium anisopliae]